MLINNDCITLKQCLFLFVGKGYSKCEIWRDDDYLRVHIGSKGFRSARIAKEQMDILISLGFTPEAALNKIGLNGLNKVNKKTLKLLGNPIITGSVEEISNHIELWEESVVDIKINGFRRKRLIILIKNNA